MSGHKLNFLMLLTVPRNIVLNLNENQALIITLIIVYYLIIFLLIMTEHEFSIEKPCLCFWPW